MSRKLVDSGVSWIGKIPEGWRLGRLKDCTSVILGKMLCSVQQDESQTLENYLCAGNIKWDGVDTTTIKQMWFSKEEKSLYLLKPGDLLTMEGGSVGTSCIYNGEFAPCYIQNSVQKICAENNAWTKFLFYWMFVVQSSGYIDAISNKATIQHYTKEKILRTPAVIPPLAEQQRIAVFLDRECEKIDGLRGKIEKQIEKLDELKKSTITEAVTGKIKVEKRGGGGESRKMKPSGVEWIGDIPEEWKVIKSSFVYDLVSDVDHYMPRSIDEGVPYVMTGDLRPRMSNVEFHKCKQISESDYTALSAKVKTKRGDIVFARYATIGTVSIVDVDLPFVVSYSCVTIRPSAALDSNFLFRYLQSRAYENEIKRFTNVGTQGNVGMASILAAKILLPPLAEQKEIAEYLDKKCAAIDAAKEKCRVQLEKLAEYKKSLIYEYVTGKRSVFADEPLRRDKEVA